MELNPTASLWIWWILWTSWTPWTSIDSSGTMEHYAAVHFSNLGHAKQAEDKPWRQDSSSLQTLQVCLQFSLKNKVSFKKTGFIISESRETRASDIWRDVHVVECRCNQSSVSNFRALTFVFLKRPLPFLFERKAWEKKEITSFHFSNVEPRWIILHWLT